MFHIHVRGERVCVTKTTCLVYLNQCAPIIYLRTHSFPKKALRCYCLGGGCQRIHSWLPGLWGWQVGVDFLKQTGVIIKPTQTMHSYGQITQNYHTSVLFNSSNIGQFIVYRMTLKQALFSLTKGPSQPSNISSAQAAKGHAFNPNFSICCPQAVMTSSKWRTMEETSWRSRNSLVFLPSELQPTTKLE